MIPTKAGMDPGKTAATNILVLGSVLTILGVGTWALAAGATAMFMVPALFGAIFLLVGVILLKVRDWHRPLLWLSVLMAISIIFLSVPIIVEALRMSDGLSTSPLAAQQAVAMLICGVFILISIRRLAPRQQPR